MVIKLTRAIDELEAIGWKQFYDGEGYVIRDETGRVMGHGDTSQHAWLNAVLTVEAQNIVTVED